VLQNRCEIAVKSLRDHFRFNRFLIAPELR
jgi:hypothetical protein